MKILVDENGYKQFFEELEKLKKQTLIISNEANDSYENAVGDGWHDNFAFEESVREGRKLARIIEDMAAKQKYFEIISDDNCNDDTVNLGDSINIIIKYSENDIEKTTVILTGKYIPNIDSEIEEITLNSPLGKALYKAKIGSLVSYFVGSSKILVDIISKN